MSVEGRFNKSEFIRRFPNLKPAEIVVEAAKVGQEISPGMIWSLRSSDKRKEEGATKIAKKTAKKVAKKGKVAKKTAKKVASKLNKSEFIRRFPNLSAKEIVAKAAAIGEVISTATVYTLRSTDKLKMEGGKAGKAAKRTVKTGPKREQESVPPSAVSGRATIAFDPSDPAARKFISLALAAQR